MKEKQFILKMKMIDGMTHTFPFSVPCGEDGAPGKDGKTPVKGVDYFDGSPGKDGEDYVLTPADKEEIAQMAAAYVPDLDVGLPPVTETDNGKILKVVDGTWQEAEMSLPEGVAMMSDVEAYVNEALGVIENGSY